MIRLIGMGLLLVAVLFVILKRRFYGIEGAVAALLFELGIIGTGAALVYSDGYRPPQLV
jgi:hypothetical protein